LDHGTNCVLFKNPQEFVSLLRQLKSDPLFCAKLADGARKTFETHYDARVVCGRMVDDFERIVESRTLQEKGVALTVSGKQPV
jgi:glycosyltransferase involved in cell wall biosynthesis